MHPDPVPAQRGSVDAEAPVPAAAGPDTLLGSSAPAVVHALVVLICLAYALAALVGVPLFADGAHYLFRLRMDGVPYVPDLRLSAVPQQLPAYLASQLGAGTLTVRHLFALSQVLLPAVSLLACWLLLRRTLPALMILPGLALLLNQINFSGVSELLAMQYVVWPLVLAMSLHPQRRAVWLYAALVGPVLLFQHALAFGAAFGLAGFGVILAWARPDLRRIWLRLALWLAAFGALRLAWSTVGLSEHYEQRMLTPDGAAFYVFTVTWGQHLLLAAVALLGLLWSGCLGFGRCLIMESNQAGRTGRGLSGGLGMTLLWWSTVLLLPLLVAIVGQEMLWGQGVRLKAAVTVMVGFMLMAAAGLVGLLRGPALARVPIAPVQSLPRRARAVPTHASGRLGPVAAPLVVALLGIFLLLMVKSVAWWTATRGLQTIVAESESPCVSLTRESPYGLQWPWMAIIDDWNAPMNALIFRPRLRDPDSGELTPISLLLPNNSCDWLALFPEVYPTAWLSVSWAQLDQRFGPLRVPESVSAPR